MKIVGKVKRFVEYSKSLYNGNEGYYSRNKESYLLLIYAIVFRITILEMRSGKALINRNEVARIVRNISAAYPVYNYRN